jgi:hypothetical protein
MVHAGTKADFRRDISDSTRGARAKLETKTRQYQRRAVGRQIIPVTEEAEG